MQQHIILKSLLYRSNRKTQSARIVFSSCSKSVPHVVPAGNWAWFRTVFPQSSWEGLQKFSGLLYGDVSPVVDATRIKSLLGNSNPSTQIEQHPSNGLSTAVVTAAWL